METTTSAPRGMVVTPHHLATQSALEILRDGGTAIEATVAAAATIAVVYPHANSIGGDAFWLITPPNGDPIVIEGCGAAGSLAVPDFFDKTIPIRGPKSALTVCGAVSSWQEALDLVIENGYQRISTHKLLADAIHYAQEGFPISRSHASALNKLSGSVPPEFVETFLIDGKRPKEADLFKQPRLATTLKHLSENGLNSFYRGNLAKQIAQDMKAVGIPITEEDLANHTVFRRTPLCIENEIGQIWNLPPPTQGLCSLAILKILDKLKINGENEGEFIHTSVEATKQALGLRDQYITDPTYAPEVDPQQLLSKDAIDRMLSNINPDRASTYNKAQPGGTVWIGVMDNKGFSVSFIQSCYHHFGSKVVLPKTGILWHNRGIAFNLESDHLHYLRPGKKPFHTLNVAAAKLRDGRAMVYGTMGGDGQPQTQTAIFHRYTVQGIPLQKSIIEPRWVYGRTFENKFDSKLRLENRFSEETVKYLKDRGHDLELIEPFSEIMGHAGALVRHTNGILEGAYDPRSDGSAAGF